jgi:acetoin utilization protein AcuB
MLVRNRMHREPITVTPDDTLAHALELTREHRIRHLPVVVPGGAITGMLSDRDIRLAMPSPLAVADEERATFLERTPIAAVMSREVITVLPTDTIEDAAVLLYRHRIGALPVVSAEGQLEGILSETDILRAFVQILGGSTPSSRIEIALPDEAGELAHVMRILGEDLQLNIVSAVVPSFPGQSGKTAILHIATIDPREALAALEAGGYQVGWPSLETDMRLPGAR